MAEKTPGQRAYEAEAKRQGWRSPEGRPLVRWQHLPQAHRDAWEQTAKVQETFHHKAPAPSGPAVPTRGTRSRTRRRPVAPEE